MDIGKWNWTRPSNSNQIGDGGDLESLVEDVKEETENLRQEVNWTIWNDQRTTPCSAWNTICLNIFAWKL